MSKLANQSKQEGKLTTYHLSVMPFSLDIPGNGIIAVTMTAGLIGQHHMRGWMIPETQSLQILDMDFGNGYITS